MADQPTYWNRGQMSRRAAIKAAAVAGSGVAALSLVGCGGGSSKSSSGSKPATGSATQVDSTKGKPGGTLNATTNIYPTGLTIIDRTDNVISKMAGLVYSGLLGYAFGRPIVKGTDVTTLEPDLAQALPEQSDNLTYVYKIKPNAKFHNGRAVTSEDVRYSYDRYANYEKSSFKSSWTWLDKVMTPDPQTAVVKTKVPFADALQSMAGYSDAFIQAKEHEESPAATEKMIGSGPFLFVSSQAPVMSSYKKNPDFFDKPYPYFDEVRLFATVDPAKRVADFSAHNVNISWWNNEDPRDEIKRNRPDATMFQNPTPALGIFMRTDKPPLNDKRVRQALAMSLDRKTIRKAVSGSEGEDDQTLSWVNESWGFRKPKDLGATAKYWNYDPAEAKKLMSAAGFDKPLEAVWTHAAPEVGSQAALDSFTLTQANWRQLGIAEIKENKVTGPQFLNGVNLGQYDGLSHGPGFQNIAVGRLIWQRFWAPAEGVKAPTMNNGFVNNSRLSDLVDKQQQQLKFEERKQSFKDIEDIVAEEQYRISFSTSSQSWFADPTLRNIQIPQFAFSGSARYFMYWWYDKA